jgi:hypothetical protein
VQIVFAMPDPAFGEGSLSLGGLVAEVAELAPASTKFDLTIELEPRDGVHRLRIEHATALISTEEAATFADRWARLLAAVVADPQQALDAIDLRAPAERTAQAAAGSSRTTTSRFSASRACMSPSSSGRSGGTATRADAPRRLITITPPNTITGTMRSAGRSR